MDTEALVDAITKIVMQRLGAAGQACPTATSVVVFGDVPDCVLGTGLDVRRGTGASDADGAQYIVLTQAAFRAFHGGVIPAGLARIAAPVEPAAASGCCGASASFDLTGKRVVGEADVRGLPLTTGATVKVDEKALVTALARDFVNGQGARIIH
ncbi:MAG: hypothetical protein FWD80_07400 [Propionibacteriaceae bacterium]|nr:hypothetical protein [Propionibacteriaceae bacterium]